MEICSQTNNAGSQEDFKSLIFKTIFIFFNYITCCNELLFNG
jgi:hypothetical protein